ncbi:prolyl oligopeptidase family serine peptidase [Actinoalloteichus hymeniacidonis]|uniref:prolyl oligopeptidase n=1 Tax=Actinoalloteichus hymeniacidonis TaxID=340345 RepID=A0AAC9HNC7_9PSEU|nr:prolyl oligopeptidase family serine peptidase [Actinoalloteichus hymeniacidonis]AOS62396.1 serine protease, S9A family peptidase [Actinoalloteichus hymeniacidonis]MBB5909574.1 prolyl oligopeptidase [Actinoalloteichus hymeniacidonis]
MATDSPSYPDAIRWDLTDDLHGQMIADPYRWLESPEDPATLRWQEQQDDLATTALGSLPGRERLTRRLTELASAGSVSVPVWRAGRAFFTRRRPGEDHPVLYVRDTAEDGTVTERVLLDMSSWDSSGRTTLDTWSPSREGALLAFQVSVGGDEHSLLHVLDVDSGEIVEGPIDRCRYSPVSWLPGGREFFYVRRLPAQEVPEDEAQFHRRVWRHTVGTDPTSDVEIHGAGLDHTNYYGVRVSADGRWLIVDARPGTAPRNSTWIADLAAGGELRLISDEAENAMVHAWVGRDERLYLLTTRDAPRWRLCVTAPSTPEPAHWQELIAEDDDSVLSDIGWLPGTDEVPAQLIVLRSRHAVSELSLHDPANGAKTGSIDLPGPGTVTSLSTVDSRTDVDGDRVWFGWTDFLTPPGVRGYSATTGRESLVEAAPGSVAPPVVHSEQLVYTSADSTPVRLFLIRPEAAAQSPRPAILTGYGGFSVSRRPAYSSAALAWVEAGGIWATASLRGGGEEGEAWHRAGMRENKQNVFDDFHAAAGELIERGLTTPEQLAIMGGSNGGLLVGAALTQRPELYRAVVCSAPLLDMVRYERFLLGRTWNDEYGSADDPTELGWLLSYSPYHRVIEDVEYPSVLFTVFESDSRVDPCHARKMCAALQHATLGTIEKRPIILRRETEVGHGSRSVTQAVALSVDQLAFLANETGLDLVG